MRIVREYFGLERTTVVYDNEISGAGGNADEFYLVAEVGRSDGTPAACTTVKFSHDEMARMLAEYRSHYPIDNFTSPELIGGPSVDGIFPRLRRRLLTLFAFHLGRRKRSEMNEPQDRT